MRSEKLSFKNEEGQTIIGIFDRPAHRKMEHIALFAHCFTCSKNLKAVVAISKALTEEGVGIFRFDFTGLGESEGEFAASNFLTNVSDLEAAAHFLTHTYGSPCMLIGHSLGGTASILAASRLPDIEALITIGSPAEASHVRHLFSNKTPEIINSGSAEVNIGGRSFTIKKHFLDALEQGDLDVTLKNLRVPLLVFHSPQDQIVGIANARKIYDQAHHPKSFISLDGADHLLTNVDDATYVGKQIAAWASRYLAFESIKSLKTEAAVAVQLGNDKYTTTVNMGEHKILADEPEEMGGNNYGPSPYDLLTAALGTCTAMTIKLYSERKNWDVNSITVHLNHRKDYQKDVLENDNEAAKIDHFDRSIELSGNLSLEQLNKIMEIADKCPVHKTLHMPVKVNTTISKR